jgi:hypothetical protein
MLHTHPEESSAMGREIESRQCIGWYLFKKKKNEKICYTTFSFQQPRLENVDIFMTIWNIYRHLGYFMTIWNILCSVGTFFPVWVIFAKKNLATLFRRDNGTIR